jgi:hypothetical protein
MTHSWRRWDIDRAAASLLEVSDTRAGDRVASHYRHFVEAACLVALVRPGARGRECSAWSGASCSARVMEASCVLDFRSGASSEGWLSNLNEPEPVRLLFVISGCSSLLRLAGRAQLVPPASIDGAAAGAASALPPTRLSVAIDAAHFTRLPALPSIVAAQRWAPYVGPRFDSPQPGPYASWK